MLAVDTARCEARCHNYYGAMMTMMRLPSTLLAGQSLPVRRKLLYCTPSRVMFSSWYPDCDFRHSVEDAQRVWKSRSTSDENDDNMHVWTESVLNKEKNDIPQLLDNIELQELKGGRMAQRQLGVLREDPVEDMRILMENYTVPSLASALRDREELLQTCAELCKNGKFNQVEVLLQPFQHEFVKRRRHNANKLMLEQAFTTSSLEILRKALARMPRRVVYAHQRRAGVVIALCNVNNTPCILLEKRASTLRAHPEEVCLPGGMVCSVTDQTIVSTCLREMQEEIGGLGDKEDFTVLGVLRCNWGEGAFIILCFDCVAWRLKAHACMLFVKVHHLVGLAVTPLVCFVGDLTDSRLEPNASEVAEVFTIPLMTLLQRKNWIHREDCAPIYVGGPHVIWGLSGFLLERFSKDILSQYHVV